MLQLYPIFTFEPTYYLGGGHEKVQIAIDPTENPPGKKVADYYFQVKPDDYNATKDIAIRYNVNGIVTGQMEKPLKLMARLAEEMGYIFHPIEVTDRCLDKWLMKETFLKHDRSLLVNDPRRKEPKHDLGRGARKKRQKSYR